MENDDSLELNTNENITIEIVNESSEECACDKNDPNIKHGPLCPGAPRPDLSNNETTPISSKIPSLVFILLRKFHPVTCR
jgi:hypothetical protein